MIRTLLATTALTAVLATTAFAQDASSSSMMDASTTDSSMMSSSMMSSSMMTPSSSMMDSSMMDSSSMMMTPSSSMMDSSAMTDTSSMMESSAMDTNMSSAPVAPFDITTGYSRVDTDRLASKIIGQPVFDSGATDANNLGEINDLVLDANGDVAAVVLGVGGFLGIGEKQVAVAFGALQWVVAADNTERYVLEATIEQLTAAPDFTTVDDNPGDTSMMDTSSAAM